MELGERLKELREAKGMTRYRMTEITGISGQHIKGIEEGTRQPTVDTLRKMAAPLGVTLSELFNDGGEAAYLSEKERRLIENMRLLSDEKADALVFLSELLKN